MVLATALAASVMVALLSVLTRFGKARNARQADGDASPVADRAAELIELDLQQARSLELRPGGFRIEGFAFIDARTRTLTHRPVTVTYRLARTGGQRWLLRRQEHAGVDGSPVVAEAFVCRGVEQLRVEPVDGNRPATLTPDSKDLPATVALKLVMTNGPAARTYERMLHPRTTP